MNRWPEFFIIGAGKCGTSSLYTYLAQHPQVVMSRIKEPHFFIDPVQSHIVARLVRQISDENEYLSLFEGAAKDQLRGEASPSYLHHAEQAAPRIRNVRPDARLICLLRDPVERAYSHYLMACRQGIETRSFADSLTELWSGRHHRAASTWIDMGRYGSQLETIFKHFERSQVQVLLTDHMLHHRQETLGTVAHFLGIAPDGFSSIDRQHNQFRTPRSGITNKIVAFGSRSGIRDHLPATLKRMVRPLFYRAGKKSPIPTAIREKLQHTYEPEVALVEQLLGKELPALRSSWTDLRGR